MAFKILTPDDIASIKIRIWNGDVYREIAQDYNITSGYVGNIASAVAFGDYPWPDGSNGPISLQRKIEISNSRKMTKGESSAGYVTSFVKKGIKNPGALIATNPDDDEHYRLLTYLDDIVTDRLPEHLIKMLGLSFPLTLEEKKTLMKELMEKYIKTGMSQRVGKPFKLTDHQLAERIHSFQSHAKRIGIDLSE